MAAKRIGRSKKKSSTGPKARQASKAKPSPAPKAPVAAKQAPRPTKKAAKKTPVVAKTGVKKTAVKKAAKKPAAKQAPEQPVSTRPDPARKFVKKAAAKKASAKPAAKKPSAKKPSAKKPSAKKPASAKKSAAQSPTKPPVAKKSPFGARSSPAPVETAPDPAHLALLAEVREALHQFDAARDRARELRRSLRDLRDGSAARAALALLDRDGDPFNLRSHVLAAVERMPEQAYFTALFDSIPRLADRAPDWGFAAVMRLLNSRGQSDDSALRFEAAIRRAPAPIRDTVSRLLADRAAGLPEEQQKIISLYAENTRAKRPR